MALIKMELKAWFDEVSEVTSDRLDKIVAKLRKYSDWLDAMVAWAVQTNWTLKVDKNE